MQDETQHWRWTNAKNNLENLLGPILGLPKLRTTTSCYEHDQTRNCKKGEGIRSARWWIPRLDKTTTKTIRRSRRKWIAVVWKRNFFKRFWCFNGKCNRGREKLVTYSSHCIQNFCEVSYRMEHLKPLKMVDSNLNSMQTLVLHFPTETSQCSWFSR